jgi:hypothetical protein
VDGDCRGCSVTAVGDSATGQRPVNAAASCRGVSVGAASGDTKATHTHAAAPCDGAGVASPARSCCCCRRDVAAAPPPWVWAWVWDGGGDANDDDDTHKGACMSSTEPRPTARRDDGDVDDDSDAEVPDAEVPAVAVESTSHCCMTSQWCEAAALPSAAVLLPLPTLPVLSWLARRRGGAAAVPAAGPPLRHTSTRLKKRRALHALGCHATSSPAYALARWLCCGEATRDCGRCTASMAHDTASRHCTAHTGLLRNRAAPVCASWSTGYATTDLQRQTQQRRQRLSRSAGGNAYTADAHASRTAARAEAASLTCQRAPQRARSCRRWRARR